MKSKRAQEHRGRAPKLARRADPAGLLGGGTYIWTTKEKEEFAGLGIEGRVS